MRIVHFLLLGLLLSNIATAHQYSIHINSCENNRPIFNAFILDNKGQLLGTTNETGDCQINVGQFPVYVVRVGFQGEKLYDLSDSNNICLQRKITTLSEVQITGKKISPSEYLLKLRDENLPYFVKKDTTLYYHFTYQWEVPKKHWVEHANGYISYKPRNIHSYFPTDAHYIQYNCTKGDGKLISNQFYDSAIVLGFDHLLYYNIMANTGFSLWNRLINKENKGIKIPIPKFIIRKAIKKAAGDKDNQLYLDVNRNLILTNINSNQIFSTFASSDTGNLNILEKIVFDKDNRLSTVEYFTPEQIKTRGIPISEKVRESDKSFSRINSTRSYYYSKYTYSNEKPRMLTSAIHIGIGIKDGIYYRTKVQLSLIDSIPAQNMKIPIYDTKCRAVLSDIKSYDNSKYSDDDEIEQNLKKNTFIRKAINSADSIKD